MHLPDRVDESVSSYSAIFLLQSLRPTFAIVILSIQMVPTECDAECLIYMFISFNYLIDELQ